MSFLHRDSDYALQRQRIRFYGRVQSVGFRFTAYDNARNIGTTGWVKNECDGTVLMEVQGTEAQIDKLIRDFNTNPYIRIDDMDVEMLPIDSHEDKFTIKH